MQKHIFLAIDLKSFYASVECSDRNLDPLTTNLVVADASRTDKTICLAVSPSLKAQGVPGRPRLFEVIERVNHINQLRLRSAIRLGCTDFFNGVHMFRGASYHAPALLRDPSLKLIYITAPPRMARYIEVSSQIYGIYLKYLAPEDIYVYSIDEVFIDITPYLSFYQSDARQLARDIILDILSETGITAAAGIGTNLYLAKVAMDILAKQMPPDAYGVRIAELDEIHYRLQLWNHRPLCDFWRIGSKTEARLFRMGITTMGDLARYSLYAEEALYKEFGIDAELLIDHAWGIEPCEMEHLKQYVPQEHSLCEGQVLTEPYPFSQGQIILLEMAESLAFQLIEKNLVTESLTLHVGYDKDSLLNTHYCGPTRIDSYGRRVPVSAHGTARLPRPSSLGSEISDSLLSLYHRIVNPQLLIRRITLTANRIHPDTGYTQLDLFHSEDSRKREENLQRALLSIRRRYGKNAVLKGTSYRKGATMRERNQQIGGHKA